MADRHIMHDDRREQIREARAKYEASVDREKRRAQWRESKRRAARRARTKAGQST